MCKHKHAQVHAQNFLLKVENTEDYRSWLLTAGGTQDQTDTHRDRLQKAGSTPFPSAPTQDLEVTALPVGASGVGGQAEVVAGILGEDWLDPQRTLRQNLQPGTQGGLAMETLKPVGPERGWSPDDLQQDPLCPAFPVVGC